MSDVSAEQTSLQVIPFREALKASNNIVILAGAGLSAASGIPTFRDGGGMWRSLDATSLATPEAFDVNPSLVWQFYHYRRRIALSAQPNIAHHIIAKLLVPTHLKKVAPNAESCHLITQNVDGLSTISLQEHCGEMHSKKKNTPKTSILEMHGRLFDINCTNADCGYSREDRSASICPSLVATDEASHSLQDAGSINRDIPFDQLPRCERCGALARPGVVWFGEKPHHVDEINLLVFKADMILVIGTSSTVRPASTFAYRVKRRGGKVAIFNLESSQQDEAADFVFTGACEEPLFFPPLPQFGFIAMFKLSINTILVSGLVLSVVSACPTPGGGNNASLHLGPSQGNAVGAAYFITNGMDGNYVVSADIDVEGKLSIRKATATGGVRSHGITANGPTGVDPLFSQGAVVVHQATNLLATVNAGSNTVSLFSIDPASPSTLKPVGTPIPSGGEFPASVAFNKAGDVLCVLNGGAKNGVGCFKVDGANGLSVVENGIRSLNLNQTTPGNGTSGGTVSQILFSEDDKQVIAAVKGTPDFAGFLALWDIDCEGKLSEEFQSIETSEDGTRPFSVSLIPEKNAVLSADPTIGYQVFDLGSKQATPFNVTGQAAICWSSYSSTTGNFYLTDAGMSIVNEVSVDDSLQGTLVKQYQLPANSSTLDNAVASINGNDYLYVLSAAATAVDVLSLGSEAAQASTVQRLDIAGPGSAAGLKIDAFYLQGMATFVKPN
ncbi:hypothetical protein VNI00_001788 [Paramarasmius palmivorus]|uniref:Deacetylase sirtuin-type domain-containing protein n=1 Tax=Paramarasmius palmivorus TaxID=297713 RepID=A0AAW0E3K4_9AGAR